MLTSRRRCLLQPRHSFALTSAVLVRLAHGRRFRIYRHIIIVHDRCDIWCEGQAEAELRDLETETTPCPGDVRYYRQLRADIGSVSQFAVRCSCIEKLNALDTRTTLALVMWCCRAGPLLACSCQGAMAGSLPSHRQPSHQVCRSGMCRYPGDLRDRAPPHAAPSRARLGAVSIAGEATCPRSAEL